MNKEEATKFYKNRFGVDIQYDRMTCKCGWEGYKDELDIIWIGRNDEFVEDGYSYRCPVCGFEFFAD